MQNLGGSPGLVVMGGDSCFKGCEYKSQHLILDGYFFHIPICCKFFNVCWKRQKQMKKMLGLAHFLIAKLHLPIT